MSLAEFLANVVVGNGLVVAAQILIFPVFGPHATLAENLWIGVIFTALTPATRLRAIAAELDARGMLTRRGGRWHVLTVTNLLEKG